MNPVYIYALRDPETLQIRYIGKSIRPKERLTNHLNERSDNYRCHWLQQLVRRGLKPIQEILEQVSEGVCWQDREKFWISEGRRMGWPLTNSTDGGDGTENLSGEGRARRIAAWTGRKHRPESLIKIGQGSKGRRHTEEYKRMMREKMSVRHFSEEHRKRISKSQRKVTPEQVAAIAFLRSKGILQKDVAKALGLTLWTVKLICQGKPKYLRDAEYKLSIPKLFDDLKVQPVNA